METEISSSIRQSLQLEQMEPPSSTNTFLSGLLNLFEWSEPVGIFSSNRIPPDIKKSKSFTIICNLSRHGEPGTHFVSIIKRGGHLLYLDPLAMYIELNRDISTFIESCNPASVIKLARAVQHPKSWLCGYFCVFFSLLYKETCERKDIVQFEEKHLQKNDCICIRNIAKMIENKACQ